MLFIHNMATIAPEDRATRGRDPSAGAGRRHGAESQTPPCSLRPAFGPKAINPVLRAKTEERNRKAFNDESEQTSGEFQGGTR